MSSITSTREASLTPRSGGGDDAIVPVIAKEPPAMAHTRAAQPKARHALKAERTRLPVRRAPRWSVSGLKVL